MIKYYLLCILLSIIAPCFIADASSVKKTDYKERLKQNNKRMENWINKEDREKNDTDGSPVKPEDKYICIKDQNGVYFAHPSQIIAPVVEEKSSCFCWCLSKKANTQIHP